MYEVLFYDTIDGKCPVQDFLDSLEPKILAKTLRTIDLLETMVHSYVNHTPNTFKMDSLNYEQNKDLILPEFSTSFL